ncbi:MAG: efflux RND transporter periplasmic adaptor subunit [Opitutae bacterium]|nr:efflux RND transporter periplasmic adaptor subunit [Opitutae bacterium]
MKKFLLGTLVLVVAIATLAAVRFARDRGDSTPTGAETVLVTRRDIGSFVKATGIVKPRVGAEVRVGSRVSGVVKRLHVMVGDSVVAGQLLAELDDRDLAARRDQAAADVRRSEAELRYAEADRHRQRELATAAVTTANDLELAERGAAVAEQQLAVARANLVFAETQLDYSRITAPIDGVVASVATQEGETVAASFAAPTFVTLVDLSRLEVWAYVDETDIGRLQVGQNARFTVDTYTDREFEGRVTAIYPKAEIRDNVVNYITVVRFELPRDRTLRPDMTTTVRIAIAQRQHVLSLPLRAVRQEGDRAFVWVRRGEKIARQWIATGSRDDTACEIADGLHEGDEAIVGDVDFQGENPP